RVAAAPKSAGRRKALRASASIVCPACPPVLCAPPLSPADTPATRALPHSAGDCPRRGRVSPFLSQTLRVSGALGYCICDRSYHPLTMTRRAACQLARVPDIAFCFVLPADFSLIRRGLPRHVVNLIQWPQRHFGVPMTLQA